MFYVYCTTQFYKFVNFWNERIIKLLQLFSNKEYLISMFKLHINYTIYRDSLDNSVFAPPGNCTIPKTVLIGDWFSTKTLFMTFGISKSPFLLIFTRIFKIFWFLKLKKWLLCLFWHVYWEIYRKFWLSDTIFNMDGYIAQFIAIKFLRLLR